MINRCTDYNNKNNQFNKLFAQMNYETTSVNHADNDEDELLMPIDHQSSFE
jgi:hypothetical protein